MNGICKTLIKLCISNFCKRTSFSRHINGRRPARIRFWIILNYSKSSKIKAFQINILGEFRFPRFGPKQRGLACLQIAGFLYSHLSELRKLIGSREAMQIVDLQCGLRISWASFSSNAFDKSIRKLFSLTNILIYSNVSNNFIAKNVAKALSSKKVGAWCPQRLFEEFQNSRWRNTGCRFGNSSRI